MRSVLSIHCLPDNERVLPASFGHGTVAHAGRRGTITTVATTITITTTIITTNY